MPKRGVGWLVSWPSSNDHILRDQSPLAPEIRSFEKCYIGWVKTMVYNFYVSGLKCMKLHRRLADYLQLLTHFRLTISCTFPKLFAVKSGSCPKLDPSYNFSGRHILERRGPQNFFSTNFHFSIFLFSTYEPYVFNMCSTC